MSYGVIYCLTNKTNGKRYIGQTTQNVKYRLTSHIGHDHCRYLHNALKKYGVDAFDVSILAECDDQESLNVAEVSFIERLETLWPNGYNLKSGGSNGIVESLRE